MDNLFKYFGDEPRPLGLLPAVASVGVVPHKRDRVRHAFESFNLSFILSGRGYYRYPEKNLEFEVSAPMVLTQWPSAGLDYGPEPEWFEIFAIYPAAALGRWRSAGIDPEERCCWPVADPGRFMEVVRRLMCLLETPVVEALAVDMCLYELVSASRAAAPSRPGKPAEVKFERQRSQLREHLDERPDYLRMARQLGMSFSTFRRRWRESCALPPGRERARWQRERACRLLVETELPVKDIAWECGFADALYFSRRFRQWTGDTPTEYRRRYRPPF